MKAKRVLEIADQIEKLSLDERLALKKVIRRMEIVDERRLGLQWIVDRIVQDLNQEYHKADSDLVLSIERIENKLWELKKTLDSDNSL